jgi:lysyl-tRNA synthetase class 2
MAPEESRRLSEIKFKLERRSLILESVRAFFCRKGFIEIETPVRVPAIAPEQYILPYTSENWYLSTSPELQMKRLLAAGYDKIFQICHCFRKNERGQQHNPEFTMLEWYRTGADYRSIIEDTEGLICGLAQQPGQSETIRYQGKQIDLSLPWPEIRVREAYLRWAGWDPFENFDSERFDIDMAEKVIPCFPADKPTVILDYPAECASLARLKPGPAPGRQVAERAEIFIGGLEISNGFSELNDAQEQKERFKLELEIMRKCGKPAAMPEKFLEAVKHLPDCTGNALGIDRLVMLLLDTNCIDDVMAFPSDLL